MYIQCVVCAPYIFHILLFGPFFILVFVSPRLLYLSYTVYPVGRQSDRTSAGPTGSVLSHKMRATLKKKREGEKMDGVRMETGGIKNMVNLCLQPPTVNPSGFQRRRRRLLISWVVGSPLLVFFFVFFTLLSCLLFLLLPPLIFSLILRIFIFLAVILVVLRIMLYRVFPPDSTASIRSRCARVHRV